MTWQPFDPPDLFGQSAGAPVRIWRGALASYDPEPAWLERELGLDQLEAVMGGRVYPVPRLEGWWGSRPYRFGGRVVEPRVAWTPGLEDAAHFVRRLTGEAFDSCFANFYRDGDDHIPWHADDDSWIGPVIASVSIGATRRFWMRRKDDHTVVVRGELRHGDLLLMEAGCQDEWEHSVPKESRPVGPRLNLTFRQTRSNA